MKTFIMLSKKFKDTPRFLHFTFYILQFTLVILLLSCTTAPSTQANLSGQVELVNDTADPSLTPIDFSGMTVAIYNLAYLDTTIVRINQEYPQIGVQISQETEFDHRLQTPVKYTTTDAEGKFKIEGLSSGKYNIAFLKEGWSLKYIYNVNLEKGENQLHDETSESKILNIKFKTSLQEKFNSNKLLSKNENHSVLQCESVATEPSPHYSSLNTPSPIPILISENMPSVISTPMTFKAGKQYNFLENTAVTSPINFEPGTLITILQLKKVSFYNGVYNSFSNFKYVKFNSNYSINSINSNCQLDSTNYFSKVDFINSTSLQLTNILLKNSLSGLNISNYSTSISNSIFANTNSSIIVNTGSINISNCLIKNSIDRAINVTNNSNDSNILTFIKNIVAENKYGLNSYNITTNVSDSYFIKNSISFVNHGLNCNVRNSKFYKDYISIMKTDGSLNAQYNIFSLSDMSNIFFSSQFTKSSGVINHNNFLSKFNYYIYIYPTIWGQVLNSDIDASNNYFINQQIDEQIYDKYDNNLINFECIINPRLNNPVYNAGIQIKE